MRNKAQSIIEYTLFIGLITAAFFAMNTYGKRGIQSVIKLSADNLGAQEETIPIRENISKGFEGGLYSEKSNSRFRSASKQEINPSTGKVTNIKGSFSETLKQSVTAR